MKKLLVLIILSLAILGGYLFYTGKLESIISMAGVKTSEITDKLSSLKEKVTTEITNAVKKTKDDDTPDTSIGKVTLHLKNGTQISGDLIRETPEEVIIFWKGGEVSFTREEIDTLEHDKIVKEKEGFLFPELEKEWPYQHEVVVQLTNTEVLDAQIAEVWPEKILLKYPVKGGGSIEQEIERARIEYLLFKPVNNEESRKTRESLVTQFPKMRFYDDGMFTIVTDSSGTWVKRFKKVTRDHATDFYFTYFKILKNRRPKVQNFIVIFDNIFDYYEYGWSDGIPPGYALGYFSPLAEVLYLPNYLGAKMEELLEDVYLGAMRKGIGMAEDSIKQVADERYHKFIEGQGDEIKAKFVSLANFARSVYRARTYFVLRHEGTHELFHNWELQDIVVSKPSLTKEELAKRKKEYLETNWDDRKQKIKLLKDIVKRKSEAYEEYEAEAANSWFVEGVATYSQTDPIGEIPDMWLYAYQEAKRKGLLLPLEQLTVYKLGSFSGVTSEATGAAYGQSWGFTYFLMNNYPDKFMGYLGRMTRETPKDDEDILWLLEALGKDLREVETEFLEYMDQFEEIEHPELKELDFMIELFS